jgi:hypothetical protein
MFLKDDVADYMEKGWQPFGGISITESNQDEVWLYQAMVKYAD